MHLTVLGQAIARLPPVILHVAMVYNGVFGAVSCLLLLQQHSSAANGGLASDHKLKVGQLCCLQQL